MRALENQQIVELFEKHHVVSAIPSSTCCLNRERLSVTNLSSENNFADVSTECSSRHQGESGRSAKQRCYL